MMVRRIGVVGLVCCALVAGGFGCGSAETTVAAPKKQAKYPIQLERDLKPGVAYRVRIEEDTTEHATFTLGGKVVKQDEKTSVLRFVGTRKVLGSGKRPPSEYVVEELTINLGGKAEPILPEGTRIVATPVADQWQYRVDDKPVSEEVDKHLGTLFGRNVSSTSDDDLFGSKVPRAVGESWPAELSKLSADEEIVFEPQDGSGAVRLVAVRTVDGVECLEVEGSLKIKKLSTPGMPADAKVHRAALNGRFLGLFPTALSEPALNTSMEGEMTMQFEVASPKGPVLVDMEMTSRKMRNRE
jgi:hypothetical protein